MIEPIQLIAILFAIFAWSRALLRFRDKKINWQEFTWWSFVWLLVIIFSSIPKFISFFSEKLGIKRPVDIFMYLGLLILFYLVFRLYVKIESIEQNLTKVIRDIAFKKNKK